MILSFSAGGWYYKIGWGVLCAAELSKAAGHWGNELQWNSMLHDPFLLMPFVSEQFLSNRENANARFGIQLSDVKSQVSSLSFHLKFKFRLAYLCVCVSFLPKWPIVIRALKKWVINLWTAQSTSRYFYRYSAISKMFFFLTILFWQTYRDLRVQYHSLQIKNDSI